MKVYVKGTGKEVDLTQRDLVGQGGEGVVYARGGVAYKVYHEASHMLPEGKIRELSAIHDPFVIRPKEVLVNRQGHPIGYTTTFVPNAWTLCQLFPISFRQREGLTPSLTQELVLRLQDRIVSVHQAGVLIVDCNEMNFLVDKQFENVFSIDVDSYETEHYPAPAIMDSIRDWTAKKWSHLSDWYSFGILAFQMFVGVHPFKGKYHGKKAEYRVKLPTDSDDDMFAVTRRRMQHNISVFHPEVSVPGVALPFDAIPDKYRDWFKRVFAQGERCLPPSKFAPVVFVPIPVAQVSGTKHLDITEVGSYEGTVIGVWYESSHLIVSTDKGVWIDAVRTDANPVIHCGSTSKTGRVVGVSGGTVPSLYNLTDRTVLGPLALAVEEVSSYDGRIYVRATDSVYEVGLMDAGTQIVPAPQEVAQTLPHATRLYPGVAIQKLLGATYASLFIQSGAAQQVALPPLDPYRIVDAKFSRGVLMVIGERKGQYDRFVFRFDSDGAYDVRKVAGVSPVGLNFVTLDSGVCVCLNEEEKLEVFSAKVGSAAIKYVEDAALSGDMRLWQQPGALLFSKGSKVYRMKMK